MTSRSSFRRRAFLGQLFGAAGVAGAGWAAASLQGQQPARSSTGGDSGRSAEHFQQFKPMLRITKLETMLVQPRWLFLKMHTDAGIAGWGEPILEGRAKTCAMAVEEIVGSPGTELEFAL